MKSNSVINHCRALAHMETELKARCWPQHFRFLTGGLLCFTPVVNRVLVGFNGFTTYYYEQGIHR